MLISGRGKFLWPELERRDGVEAAKIIERQNPRVHAVILREGTIVSMDLRCERVRVWVDDNGIVTEAPKRG